MAAKSKPEPKTETPKLKLSSFPALKHPQQYSGAITPLHTSASVPFSWEQEPGKPLPCLTLALPNHNYNSNYNNNYKKCLELPPRLLNEGKMTKTPSPTTVLEGPYSSLGRSILGSNSFRFLRKRRKSFDEVVSFAGSAGSSPDRGLLGDVVVNSGGKKDKGLFGSWRKKGGVNYKGKSEFHGGNFVFPSYSDDGTASCYGGGGGGGGDAGDSVKKSQLGLSKQAKSHFWATIYGTFKQVIPRRSTKCKKDVF